MGTGHTCRMENVAWFDEWPQITGSEFGTIVKNLWTQPLQCQQSRLVKDIWGGGFFFTQFGPVNTNQS